MRNLIIKLSVFSIILVFVLGQLGGCSCTKDTISPVVQITNPRSNSSVSGIVIIQAEARDDIGVTKVEFFIDGEKVGEDNQPLYKYWWDTTNLTYGSTHTIKAKAYDAAGNMGESPTITVTIGDDQSPLVTITSPTNGSTVTGAVTIKAEVVDRSISKEKKGTPSGIQKVEFYVDGTRVGEDTTSPYECSWDTDNLQYGSTHTIKAKAYDNAGNVGESPEVRVVIGDSQAPQVTIISPENGDTVTGMVKIQVEAVDRSKKRSPSGIQKVEFYIDGNKVGEDLDIPYEYFWNTDSLAYNSSHTIQAKAYDVVGNMGVSSTITVTIGDEQPPLVTITDPTNGAKVTGTVTIKAEVVDRSISKGKNRAPSGIQKVEFYVDDNKIGEDLTSPYQYDWDTTGFAYGSTHTIKAKAYDAAGNMGESPTITVTIGDDQSPLVTITNPRNGDVVSEVVIIRVTANDRSSGKKTKRAPSGIKKIELFIDGEKVGESTTSPYEYEWDTVTYENGKYTLIAKAYDIAGTPESESEPVIVTVNNPEIYRFLLSWGSLGSDDGQFNKPRGIALDSLGNVYVVDYNNHRIQKFDSSGNFITAWGEWGDGNRQFKYPFGIAIDSLDNIYVTDTGNHRIQKFDSSGNFITAWGEWGDGNRRFKYPCGIAIDPFGNVYVADTYNNRIQKFDSSGNFITKWGSLGTNNGQFKHPFGIAVDSLSNVYVADTENCRIQKFNSSGSFTISWGDSGSDNGQFKFPYGVAVDTVGNVYVVDTENNRIQKFTPNGVFITKWGLWGSKPSHFKWPYGIVIEHITDNVYVVDTENNRIQKFECIRRARKK